MTSWSNPPSSLSPRHTVISSPAMIEQKRGWGREERSPLSKKWILGVLAAHILYSTVAIGLKKRTHTTLLFSRVELMPPPFSGALSCMPSTHHTYYVPRTPSPQYRTYSTVHVCMDGTVGTGKWEPQSRRGFVRLQMRGEGKIDRLMMKWESSLPSSSHPATSLSSFHPFVCMRRRRGRRSLFFSLSLRERKVFAHFDPSSSSHYQHHRWYVRIYVCVV